MKRLLAVIVSLAIVVSGTPAAALEAAGSPWKDWFVYGVLTQEQDVRLEDDYYTAVNRESILARNKNPNGPLSVPEEREDQMNEQMLGLLTADSDQGDLAHDVQCLCDLYNLHTDWDKRDATGTKPIDPIIDRINGISTMEDLTDWLCSDDYRLAKAWRPAEGDPTISMLSVRAYNPIEGDKALPYEVEAYLPDLALAPFEWSDDDVMDGDRVDMGLFYDLQSAARLADSAYLMLVNLGFSEREAEDIVCDAAELESIVDNCSDYEEPDYKEFTHDGLAKACEGGFPLDKILDSLGYDDAKSISVEYEDWIEGMHDAYTQENLQLWVSHELASFALQSAELLDSKSYNALADADGNVWLSEELLKASGADNLKDDDVPEPSQEEVLQTERRLACDFLRRYLPTSFGKVYVANFYDEKTTEEVKKMAEDYIQTYAEMLGKEDWISQQTRDRAIEKVRAIRINVSHPKNWGDTSGIVVDASGQDTSLFSVARELNDASLDIELDFLRHPEKGQCWQDCTDVNAYYDDSNNAILIGVGILGGVFWPDEGTYEQRLAGVGTTIGHEISHAFDSTGAYRNKDGKIGNWWEKADLEAFEKRVERVEEAFSNMDPLGKGAYDGAQVGAEAIADMGGLKATMALATNRKDFDYDAFFRAYANSWDGITFMDDAMYSLEVDTHPFDNYRVNVPVREVDEFYRTYDVDKDDDMWLDEDDRISVW